MNAWLVAVLVAGGASVSALLLWLSRVLSERGPDDRRFKDRPPPFWRLTWWLVLPIAFHLGPWLSVRARHAQLERLRRAGLDFALSPEQFVAGKCIAALAAASLVVLAWSPRGVAPAWLAVAWAYS